ncbi:hypothetical protein BBO99_00009581 [Phytophthora kernoviae]|uniref:Uncharacterized protein n=1 Tax=Phytophthora kernoviae TaxID=325452 RepID=A0A3R7J8M4_9STRA|nr:hypothetical protein BBI17_009624 [Phytophthora kernoviae]RLN73036.1 hypothetical protein BBO99_00009581 [Phytophthora kernoviae]
MPAKMATGAALAEARKGKKKLTKRSAGTGDGGIAPRKSAQEATKESETDVEERAASPPAKKTRKILASTPTVDLLRPAGTKDEQGFNLSTYLSSFDPGLGRDESTHAGEERDSPGGNVVNRTDVTAPNAKGDLPLPELRYPTNASI